MLTRCRTLLLILALLGPASAYAQKWSGLATISATSVLVTNSLCYNDGRDLACDSSAGLRITSGTVAFSNISATNVSASTINGIAVGSLGGSGASKLASLTDVDVSGKVSGSVLVYTGATTSWTALPIQNVMSTTTMVTNWPDAITCNVTTPTALGLAIFYADLVPYTSGKYYYSDHRNGTNFDIIYKADGTFDSYSNITASDCNTSIASLYTSGKAFNFIGNSGTGGGSGSGDRITSGTLLAVANSATGYISLTTGATNWGYLSSAASYIPNLTSNFVSATSISASTAYVKNTLSVSGSTYVSDITIMGTASGAGINPTVSVSASGADTQVQYNSSGSLAGSSNFTYSAGLLTLTGTVTTTNLYASSVSGTTGTFGSITVGSCTGCGGGGGTGDRIISGTTGLTAISNTKTISITTNNVVTGYFNSNGVLTVPGISATSNLTSVTTLSANQIQYNLLTGGTGVDPSFSVSASGADTQVQYNSSGSLAGSSSFTYSAGLLTLTGTVTTTNLYASSVSGTTGTFGSITVGSCTGCGGGGGTGDRIISGTTGLTAISNTKTISITTNNVVTGYFNSNGVLTVPGISATSNLTSVTTLSANQIQLNLLTGGTGVDPSFSVSASGANTQVQYNSSGNLAGSSAFTYSSGLLTVTNISTTNISVSTINGTPVGSLGGGGSLDDLSDAISDPTATGSENLFLGFGGGVSITTGNQNTGGGLYAFSSLADGGQNTAFGFNAMSAVTSGNQNTAIGYLALSSNVNGSNNVAIGHDAATNATGDGNIAIGAGTFSFNNDSGSSQLNIGNVIWGDLFNGYIGINVMDPRVALEVSGIVSSTGVNVTGDISYTGVLTDTSDRRLKHDIKPLPFTSAMERLMLMKPVQFKMNDRPDRVEWGFVAQDVEKLFPNLVFTANDAMGTKTLNYIGMIAPMVQGMQELQKENDDLRKRLDKLEKFVNSQQRH
jgi:hypothetical protein